MRVYDAQAASIHREEGAAQRAAPACRGFSSQCTLTSRLTLFPGLWEEPGKAAGGRVLGSHRARNGLCFQQAT